LKNITRANLKLGKVHPEINKTLPLIFILLTLTWILIRGNLQVMVDKHPVPISISELQTYRTIKLTKIFASEIIRSVGNILYKH
jgi:hypothetical protein